MSNHDDQVFSSIMKWFLTICSVLTFGAGLAFGYLGHDGLLVAGLIGFGALLVAANLDQIAEFKASGSGIEAKTREVVARAETAITELQLLATHLAELSLSIVKRLGRWDGYTDEEQDAIRSSVLNVLEKLGIPESTKQSVLREWHRVVEFDYSHFILGGCRTPENAPSDVMAEWSALRTGGITDFPAPEVLQTFLSKHGFLTPDLEELIRDYEHYRKNRIHRRPTVWQDRRNWGHLKKT